MKVLKRCFVGSRVRGRALVLSLWLALSLSLAGSGASAQEDAAESRSTSFQAVEGPTKEDVPGGPLLVYAYAFIMVALVAYVARLGSLQGKNRAELDRLTRALEHGRPAGNERS